MQPNSEFINTLKDKLSAIDSPIIPVIYLLCEETEYNAVCDEDGMGVRGKPILLTSKEKNTSPETFFFMTEDIYDKIKAVRRFDSLYIYYTLKDLEEMTVWMVEHYKDFPQINTDDPLFDAEILDLEELDQFPTEEE